MRIFLLRHGEAEPADSAERDEERALTDKGAKRLRKAGRGFRRLDIFPDRILSSPLKRALQTAEIVADELGFTGQIEAVEELAPSAEPEDLISVLRDMSDVNQILLVGHQPFLGELAAALIGAPGGRIALKKGGLARVDVEDWNADPPGRLRYLLTGKQLIWLRRKKKAKDEGED